MLGAGVFVSVILFGGVPLAVCERRLRIVQEDVPEVEDLLLVGEFHFEAAERAFSSTRWFSEEGGQVDGMGVEVPADVGAFAFEEHGAAVVAPPSELAEGEGARLGLDASRACARVLPPVASAALPGVVGERRSRQKPLAGGARE